MTRQDGGIGLRQGEHVPRQLAAAVEAEWFLRQQSLLGEQGMRRLREATIFVAGVGGLGGATATYLAAAGVGRLILLHDGVVERPDLNRQTLMGWDGIGKRRVLQAQANLQRLYPYVSIEVIDAKVTDVSLDPWLAQTDLVVDARYAIEERYALNRMCVKHEVPMVEAAMNGWELYVFTVMPHAGPCLHCLFPEGARWEGKGFPVLGSVCATAGTLAANEAIKRVAGIGVTRESALYWFNLLTMQPQTVQVQRRVDCSVCGGDEVTNTGGGES